MVDGSDRNIPDTERDDFYTPPDLSYADGADEQRGELQALVRELFSSASVADNLDLIAAADIHDVGASTREVVDLLPSGTYTRRQMSDQLNSIITAHGWGTLLGTVS